jgi:hypothetical protein
MLRLSLVISAVMAVVIGVTSLSASVVVVPNGNTSMNGNGFTVAPITGCDISSGSCVPEANTLQVLFAGSQFGSVPVGSQITAIGFRLGSSEPTGPASALTDDIYRLQLSTSPSSLGSLSHTFANNIGPDVVTVYDSSLTVSANSLTGGAGPNPFL